MSEYDKQQLDALYLEDMNYTDSFSQDQYQDDGENYGSALV